MKRNILIAVVAMAAVVFGLQFGGATPTQATAGPGDIQFNLSLSTTTAGQPVTTTIDTHLGESTPHSTAPDLQDFFHTGNFLYGGITPTAAPLGSLVGSISFHIQTNVDTGLLLQGNIDSTTGQPPRCQEKLLGGETYLQASVSNFPLYAATTSTGAPIVSTGSQSANATYSTLDQVPDPVGGGAPMAVTHLPDWYLPFLKNSNIDTASVISRQFGIAAVENSKVSVNLLAVNNKDGTYSSLVILANPSAAFTESAQATETCTPYGSTAIVQGQSTSHTWDCTADYFNGSPSPCTSGTFTGGVGTVQSIPSAASGAYQYKYVVTSDQLVADNHCDGTGTSNLGQPSGVAECAGAQGTQFLSTNGAPYSGECPFNPDPSAADSLNNGIGNTCRTSGLDPFHPLATPGGGNEVNSDPTAVANASLQCTSFEATHTSPLPTRAEASYPWAACQSASQDGALNSVDNCPFVANGPRANGAGDNQDSTARDGIGDACAPAPGVPGDGHGYKNTLAGLLFTTDGQYTIRDDTCTASWTQGTGPVSNQAATCGLAPADENGDGTPDFSDTGTGHTCLADHFDDVSGGGYSDADKATPPKASGLFTCSPQPSAGGLGQDPISVYLTNHACGASNCSVGVWATGCFSNPKLARSDVDLNGVVNGLDINQISTKFGQHTAGPSDFLNELDLDKNGVVNGLDINIASTLFGQKLATGTSPACVNTKAVTKSADDRGTKIQLGWDRVPQLVGPPSPADSHQVTLKCTGAAAGAALQAGITTSTVGPSGTYPWRQVPDGTARSTVVSGTAFPCTVSFDGTVVATLTTGSP